MAEKKVKEEVNEEVVVTPTKPNRNERKPYTIHFQTTDPNEEKQELVIVNGKSKLILKEKQVMIPDSFVRVLDNAKKENEYAARVARASQDAYFAKMQKLSQ